MAEMTREEMAEAIREAAKLADANEWPRLRNELYEIADYLERQPSQQPMTVEEIKKHCDGKPKIVTALFELVSDDCTGDDEFWLQDHRDEYQSYGVCIDANDILAIADAVAAIPNRRLKTDEVDTFDPNEKPTSKTASPEKTPAKKPATKKRKAGERPQIGAQKNFPKRRGMIKTGA